MEGVDAVVVTEAGEADEALMGGVGVVATVTGEADEALIEM